MKFNFDYMMQLHQNDPEMFELQRKELLNAAIARGSEHQRVSLRVLQNELDEQRRVNPDRFIQDCFNDISQNLTQLTGLWKKITRHSQG